jgi:hypothetical protein
VVILSPAFREYYPTAFALFRKMKRIQRRAYGFRNVNNYRLRVILLRRTRSLNADESHQTKKRAGCPLHNMNPRYAGSLLFVGGPLVEPIGIEPTTSTMPLWRSSN